MRKIGLKLLLLIALFLLPVSIYAQEKEELINENENVLITEENNQPTTYESNQYQLIIDDQANLLTEDEINKLQEEMKDLLEYGHIAFVSTNSNYSSAESFARTYYHNHFSTDSGTLFLIDMDNRMIYIFSDGENHRYITNSKATIITDNIYKYASREEYYECAHYAFKQIKTILEGGKIAEPMRHTSNIVLSLVLAFFINFFIVTGKSKIKSASSNSIVKDCDISFAVNSIKGTKTGTHKVYNPPSDSGGSSGGGGGGGGGGSSGGGGGHSF